MRWTSGILSVIALLAMITTAHAATIPVSGNIVASETWTSDNEYILTDVIYVEAGATLTIQPGTVIRGESESAAGANDPGTLVITRGARILALGTEDKPIVFTNLDDDNIGGNPGTFPYDSRENAQSFTGTWGGVVLLGRGYVANNTLAGTDSAREVQIEGLNPAGGLGLYGNCAADPASGCDDDDSGVFSYVSIRYGGFNLSAANEINGLTLGGVGRNTDIHHVEIYQNKDDGVEFFGGAAQVKNLIVYAVGDDGVDFDEGWRGKLQHVFVVQGTPGSDKSDKGAEQDGGNAPDGSRPFAIPTIYNATYVGLGQKNYTDKARNTTMIFRDNAGGRYYNSFFADFGGAPLLIEGPTATPFPGTLNSCERARTAYPPSEGAAYFSGPDSDFQLELQDNTWWCMGNGGVVPLGDTTAEGGSSKLHCDVQGDHTSVPAGQGLFGNVALDNEYLGCASPLPIRALARGFNFDPTAPDPIDQIDPRPATGSALLNTDRVAPNDGFFDQAAYRGAFGTKTNWAGGWSNMSRLGFFPDKPQVQVSSNVTTSQTWTQDNDYVLTEVIYVEDGATLTVEPGTVIRGESESAAGANDPGTLVITRGARLIAPGTEDKPIVFTNLDDDNVGAGGGTFPYDSRENAQAFTGTWGGVVLLGRGYVANNTLAGVDSAREVQIEGLNPDGGLGLYGNCAADPASGCDDDTSGEVSFVSIRYGGFNLSAANEINGLTLGGVGRETDIHHIEIYQNKDDGVEFFGGAAQIKNLIVAAVGDDGVDYDEGWRGKLQFVLVMQGTPGTDKSDKGAEQDGGNSPDGSRPFAIPTIYNATYVGLGQKNYTDKARNTTMIFRDNAGGRYYNSFFADFGGAPLLIEGPTATPFPGTLNSCERARTPYPPSEGAAFFPGPDSDFQLELQDNTWWCTGNGGVVPLGDTTAQGGSSKLHCDVQGDHTSVPAGQGLFGNAALDNEYLSCATTVPIRELSRTLNFDPTVPDPIDEFDPRPHATSNLLNTDREAPADGFFCPAGYRGAFSQSNNWAAGWSTLSRMGYFSECDGSNDAIPNGARDLTWTSATDLAWLAPAGNSGALYDLLRVDGTASGDADDFSNSTCEETGGADTSAVQSSDPASGEIFYYIVTTQNDCGGNGGEWSDGTFRTIRSCP